MKPSSDSLEKERLEVQVPVRPEVDACDLLDKGHVERLLRAYVLQYHDRDEEKRGRDDEKRDEEDEDLRVRIERPQRRPKPIQSKERRTFA